MLRQLLKVHHTLAGLTLGPQFSTGFLFLKFHMDCYKNNVLSFL